MCPLKKMEELRESGLDEHQFYVYLCMAGEMQQGGPGCTYVDEENGRAFYVHHSKLLPQKFKETFEQTLHDDEKKHYYVVHKSNDALHVVSYPRTTAHASDWSKYQNYIEQKQLALQRPSND